MVTVEFFDGANSLATLPGPQFIYLWTASGAGIHTLTAKATDDDGNYTISQPLVITVGGAPPTVAIAITYPTTGMPFNEAQSVHVVVTGAPAASIASVKLTDSGEVLAEGPGSTLNYNFARIGCSRNLKAVATNTQGFVSSEAELSIAVGEHLTNDRRTNNGIKVGQTKLFDARSLALMLQSMQSTLANRDFHDQASIAGAINKFQGARLDTSSLSVQVTTTPLPGVSTVTNSGTPSIVETVTQPSTPAGSPTPAPGIVTATTTPSATTAQTTTQPAITPAPATLPTQNTSFSFQPAFDQAPQTLLAKQVAMNYEIANLRLLLEGALSDRMIDQTINVGSQLIPARLTRARAIAGFRISLDSLRIYRNAVAEVEITVRTKVRRGGRMPCCRSQCNERRRLFR